MLRNNGFTVGDPVQLAKVPLDDHFLTRVKRQTEEPFEMPSLVGFKQGRWILTRWEYAPSPGTDDIEVEFESLDQVVAALIAYYTGQPILMDNWVVPAHKHPEWDLKRLPSAIAEAQPITSAEWKTVEAMHSRQRWLISPDQRT